MDEPRHGAADGKKGNDRHSRRKPERAEPSQAGGRRVKQTAAAKYPGIKIAGTFYHIRAAAGCRGQK